MKIYRYSKSLGTVNMYSQELFFSHLEFFFTGRLCLHCLGGQCLNFWSFLESIREVIIYLDTQIHFSLFVTD